jgi:hypothetical protein
MGKTERSNGAFGKSDIEGKTAREAASELGKERVSNGREHISQPFGCFRASVFHFRPLTSDCPGLGRFALVILRKIDAMGSKFTADSPWNLINPTKESEI